MANIILALVTPVANASVAETVDNATVKNNTADIDDSGKIRLVFLSASLSFLCWSWFGFEPLQFQPKWSVNYQYFSSSIL